MRLVLDINSLRSQSASLISQIQQITQEELKKAAEQAKENVAATTAFKGDVLKKQVKIHQAGQYEFQIYMDSKIAAYMNDGTKPHEIRARRVRFLKFIQAGKFIYRKRVYHPGTKATHFFDEACQAAFGELAERLTDRLNAIKI